MFVRQKNYFVPSDLWVLFVNTQASLLTLPAQDQYQHFVASEALSSLSHANRHDKGLQEATYNLSVNKECPHLMSINILLLREKTPLCCKYVLSIFETFQSLGYA